MARKITTELQDINENDRVRLIREYKEMLT